MKSYELITGIKNIIKYFILPPISKCRIEYLETQNLNKFYYLGICTIIKNEAPYLKEWLEYHIQKGVELFILYDNESTDDTFSILKPYVEKGIVIYYKVYGKKMQLRCYNDCLARYKNNIKWLCFIDADEFFVSKLSLPSLLKDYEKFPAICANWVMFDSNNNVNRPDGKLVIEAYTQIHKNYCDDNMHVKTITQPSKVRYYVNAHYPILKFFKSKVNENYQKIPQARTTPDQYSIQKLRINHYFSKSEEEYLKKIDRGMADNGGKRNFDLSALTFSDGIQDDSLKEFIPTLKKLVLS